MANNNFIHDIVSPKGDSNIPEKKYTEVPKTMRETIVPREELSDSEERDFTNHNREIDTNPFLLRYARHTVTQDTDVAAPEPVREAVKIPTTTVSQKPEVPRFETRRAEPPKIKYKKVSSGGSGHGKGIWVFAFVCILALLYAVSFVFVRATVTVTPYSEPVSIDDSFQAVKDSNTGLGFSVMAVDLSDSTEVISSGSSSEDTKATGKVILYNAYSATKQNLLIDTRLEATNGKIYMTDKAITIPGYTKEGSTIIPGSVEVGVHATESGESFNTGPTDFKFVGFKSSPDKYEKFYARSKTNIEGGSTGLVYTITSAERDSAENELLAKLKERALNQMKAEVPDGYIMFDDAIFYEVNNSSNSLQSKETSVPISVSVKGTAFIFPRESLVSAIGLKTTLSTHSDKKFDIPNLDEFIFALDGKESIDPDNVEKINFTLTGEGKANAFVDKDEFAKSLINRKVKDVNSVLTNFPSILSAKVAMHPLWQRRFPENIDRIKIVLEQ